MNEIVSVMEQPVAEATLANKFEDFRQSHPRLTAWMAKGAIALATIGGGELVAADAANAADVPPQSAATTLEIQGGSVSAMDVAQKKVHILEDVHMKGKVETQTCEWTKGGFWNSGRDANGKIKFFWDPVRGELCRDKKSPTGWVKIAGGETGRDCRNVAKFPGKPPKNVIHGPVELVKHLNMNVKLHAFARAAVQESCGTAEATASVWQKMKLRLFLKAQGPGEVKIIENLNDKAIAKAKASVQCEQSPVSPVSPLTPTETTPQPPTIQMENMPTEGGFVGDTQQFCAEATSNPLTDGVEVDFSSKYDMPQTATYADPNGDPNSYCVTETFNAIVPDEQVYAKATDEVNGKTASASSNPFLVRESTGF